MDTCHAMCGHGWAWVQFKKEMLGFDRYYVVGVTTIPYLGYGSIVF